MLSYRSGSEEKTVFDDLRKKILPQFCLFIYLFICDLFYGVRTCGSDEEGSGRGPFLNIMPYFYILYIVF
jgi:hypothetical protein